MRPAGWAAGAGLGRPRGTLVDPEGAQPGRGPAAAGRPRLRGRRGARPHARRWSASPRTEQGQSPAWQGLARRRDQTAAAAARWSPCDLQGVRRRAPVRRGRVEQPGAGSARPPAARRRPTRVPRARAPGRRRRGGVAASRLGAGRSRSQAASARRAGQGAASRVPARWSPTARRPAVGRAGHRRRGAPRRSATSAADRQQVGAWWCAASDGDVAQGAAEVAGGQGQAWPRDRVEVPQT